LRRSVTIFSAQAIAARVCSASARTPNVRSAIAMAVSAVHLAPLQARYAIETAVDINEGGGVSWANAVVWFDSA
jgi:hypothetical protein